MTQKPTPAPYVMLAVSEDFVVAALDAAPEGTSPSRVGVSVAPQLCPEYDRAPMVIQAEYADGGRLQVFTRLNSCTGPDPDNGARRVVLPDNSEALFGLYAAVRR